MTKKLYCYVDETGQDTLGKLFIVSVVIAEKDRDVLLVQCEEIEKTTQKGTRKWHKTKYPARLAYLRHVFAQLKLEKKLYYSIFENTTDYDMTTITAIAQAVDAHKPTEPFTTLVYVDALRKTKRFAYGRALRKLGIHTRKVQGVPSDENNALIRLADSICGFVRDVMTGTVDEELSALFKRAKRTGMLVELP